MIAKIIIINICRKIWELNLPKLLLIHCLKCNYFVQLFAGATQRGTPENMQLRFDPVSSLLVFVKIEMYNE